MFEENYCLPAATPKEPFNVGLKPRFDEGYADLARYTVT